MAGDGVVKRYYRLTKPGIIYGNDFTAAAGFLLASQGEIDWWLMLATLVGISLVIACGCVLNNYIDRDIDRKMARTNKRALVSGTISVRDALIFAGVLGVAGLTILGVYTNALTVALGALGLFFYVVVYGVAKRTTVHGTIVGSISGALPPVAGYTAVTGHLDGAALLLFAVLVAWQMPHFYSIAMFRYKDYKTAGLPVLPVKKSMMAAKRQILVYVVLFLIAIAELTVFGYTGYLFLAVVGAVGLVWLARSLQGLRTTDDTRWARKMFGFSLIVLIVFSVMIAVDSVLPNGF